MNHTTIKKSWIFQVVNTETSEILYSYPFSDDGYYDENLFVVRNNAIHRNAVENTDVYAVQIIAVTHSEHYYPIISVKENNNG